MAGDLAALFAVDSRPPAVQTAAPPVVIPPPATLEGVVDALLAIRDPDTVLKGIVDASCLLVDPQTPAKLVTPVDMQAYVRCALGSRRHTLLPQKWLMASCAKRYTPSGKLKAWCAPLLASGTVLLLC